MDNKIMMVSDSDFIKVIKSCTGWKEITKALGYSKVPSSNTKDSIKTRCNKLGVVPNLKILKRVDNETKGGLLSKRKNYQSYRSAIRKGAEKIFSESGNEMKCAVCGYSKHVEIAHKKAVSEFPDSTLISEINSIDNLIALCPNHHWEYDNGILKL